MLDAVVSMLTSQAVPHHRLREVVDIINANISTQSRLASSKAGFRHKSLQTTSMVLDNPGGGCGEVEAVRDLVLDKGRAKSSNVIR